LRESRFPGNSTQKKRTANEQGANRGRTSEVCQGAHPDATVYPKISATPCSTSAAQKDPTWVVLPQMLTDGILCSAHNDEHNFTPVRPCLIRSHPGPGHMREPGSGSTECPLVARVCGPFSPTGAIQDKPPPHPLPFASHLAGVMQDKSIPNFVEKRCTTLLTAPVTSRRDMYCNYIFF
jgi:hypothetical protein